MKITHPLPVLFLALAPVVQAQVLDFEAPQYTIGNLTTSPFSQGTAAITNVSGWSQSGSGAPGAIVATTSSGLYTGGQAFGSGSTATAYIGVTTSFVLGAKFSLDIYAPLADKAGVSGFADLNSDGMVTYSTENGIFAGVLDSGGASRFAFRDLAIGGGSYSSGVAAATTDWYRITVTLDDATYTATMDVINLTQGGTVVDLDPNNPGTSFSRTWTDGTGWIPTSSWVGVGVRSSRTILIDNITNVPEPGTMALSLLGGLAFLCTRRRD